MQQKKQQKQGKRQEWKEQMKESDRMLKGNVLLEKPQWVLMLTLAAEFLLLVVLHVLVNTFIRFCKGHLTDCFSWSCLTTYPVLAPLYLFVVIVAIAVAILNVYRFRNAFRSLEAGQKGTSRFTTMEEIKEQLPDIRILILDPFVLRGTATAESYDSFFRPEVELRAAAAGRVAEKYGLTFVPLQKMFDDCAKEADGKLLLADGVHPTSTGHGLIAGKWMEAFEKLK